MTLPLMSLRFILIVPGKHDALLAVAHQAVKQAKDAQMPVRFTFHGVPATIMPGDTSDGILADWTDDYDSRNAYAGSGPA